MLIVGFGNRARQGKDTAGEAVVDYFNKRNERLVRSYGSCVEVKATLYKFADALYRECREQHGMTEKDAPLLQKVGMDRRAEDEDYWVKQVMQQIDTDKPDIAVITDVRFPNEVEFIQDRNGVVVNVTRLNPFGQPYIADDRPENHVSETALDGIRCIYYIKAHSGESALVEQLAICIVEFERARR